MARRLRTRQISSVEVTQAVLDQIDALEPQLGAHICVMAETAMAEARTADVEMARGLYRGPLHGVPIGIKDLFDLAGTPTTAGSEILSDAVANLDATAVHRLRAAGAVIVGKHNMHEFAFGTTTDNPLYGRCANPWDHGRTPGGSSGGTATAVTVGMCAAGIGTDTGGSVRIPAAYCGIVGFKPTYRRISRHGVIPLSWSFDHVGPLTRSVLDAAILVQAMAGPDPQDPTAADRPVPDLTSATQRPPARWRVGVPRAYFLDLLHPAVADAFAQVLRHLEHLGARVEEVEIPHVQAAQDVHLAIMSAEGAAYHEQWLRTRPGDYGVDVLGRLQVGAVLPATDYLKAQQVRALIQRAVADLFQEVDLLVTPTVPLPAPRWEDRQVTVHGVEMDVRRANNRLTGPFNLLALPAISIPCGVSPEGLPIGLQVVGSEWREESVLQLAFAYEQAHPWPLGVCGH